MPPTLSTARAVDPPNTASWNAGTSGAPWPPAATSRPRKSQTTSMPQASASSAPLFSWIVKPVPSNSPGRCRTVWPCEPTARTSPGSTCDTTSRRATTSACSRASALAASAPRRSSSAPALFNASSSAPRASGIATWASASTRNAGDAGNAVRKARRCRPARRRRRPSTCRSSNRCRGSWMTARPRLFRGRARGDQRDDEWYAVSRRCSCWCPASRRRRAPPSARRPSR